MEIIIKGESKEIADLLLALQNQQQAINEADIKYLRSVAEVERGELIERLKNEFEAELSKDGIHIDNAIKKLEEKIS